MTHLGHAQAWWDAGATPLPLRPDGTKVPAVPSWKTYQQQRPARDHLEQLFTVDHDGLGVLTGAVSGNLEMLEAEGRAVTAGLVPQLAQAFADHNLGDLWNVIAQGYAELTPTGGIHWYYRVDGPAKPNTRLARRPATADELDAWRAAEQAKADTTLTGDRHTERTARINRTEPENIPQVLFETRGEGGFTIVAPSAGRSHPTGQPWVAIVGTPHTIPTITADQRDTIHTIVSLLDTMPDPTPIGAAPRPTGTTPHDTTQIRPGDAYNAATTWDDILTPRGWTKVTQRGLQATWTRPGKHARDGISATTGRNQADNLYVFSSSTEFTPDVPYTKFGAYALLEHGGDHAAAAKSLAAQGFGVRTQISPAPLTLNATTAAPPPQTPTQAATSNLAVAAETSPIVVAVDRAAQAFGPTEDGTARALAHTHRQQLRYCAQRKEWLTWNGARWQWDDADIHRQHIKELARNLPEDDSWRTYKKRALSAAGTTGIARQAESEPAFAVHIDQLDANPYEFNTPAGVVDLRNGTIRPPDPAALHTRTTTVAPDFDRPGELFLRFLAETFGGDPALTSYVQRAIGQSIIGTVLEQMLPFAHGSGANGKGTLLEASMDALGRGDTGYSIAAPAEMLMVRRHSEHPAEIAQLAGARLVVCSELEEGAKFAEARIKQLTGGDSINARFMRGNPFTFTPTHTIWILGNHKPSVTTGGPAFWRRLQLVPFEHIVPKHLRDPRLPERLRDEAPAVLAWIIRGAADYLTHGLRPPAAVEAATNAYAADQDTVGRFVDEQCHVSQAGGGILQTPIGKLREAYERFCFEMGDTPVSAKRLTQELRDRYDVEQARSNSSRFYRGIALATPDEDEGDAKW